MCDLNANSKLKGEKEITIQKWNWLDLCVFVLKYILPLE